MENLVKNVPKDTVNVKFTLIGPDDVYSYEVDLDKLFFNGPLVLSFRGEAHFLSITRTALSVFMELERNTTMPNRAGNGRCLMDNTWTTATGSS